MDTYGSRVEVALNALNDRERNKLGKDYQKKDRAWLADSIKITQSALSQLILGKTKSLTAENHEMAVVALGCSGYWLATGNGAMTPSAPAPPLPNITISGYIAPGGRICTAHEISEMLASVMGQVDKTKLKVVVSIIGALAENPADTSLVAALEALIQPAPAEHVQKKRVGE